MHGQAEALLGEPGYLRRLPVHIGRQQQLALAADEAGQPNADAHDTVRAGIREPHQLVDDGEQQT